MRLFASTLLMLLATCAAHTEDAAVYDLHEWGVFEAPRNAAWSQMDMKAEWATLPDFFYTCWPKERLPYHGPVKKPVIYLYAEKPGRVSLQIKFSAGRPIVWWPAATTPVAGVGPQPTDILAFELNVGDVPAQNPNGVAPTPPAVPAGHWIEHLRAVKSAKLFTHAGFARNGDHINSDSFIYYDGLMQAPASPAVARVGNAVTVKSPHAYDMLDVMIVDRDEKSVRVAKSWTNIRPGETASIDLASADDKAIDRLAAELIERLTAAGLTKDEAASLEKVWHDGLFKRDGMSIFYHVPQAIYDQWLPLTAKPQPKKTVRVGLVFHAHMEPELDATVEGLIGQLAAETFEERESAQKKLIAIGGAAFPALEKHAADKEPEISNRCRRIVESLDARAALQQKPAK